MDNVGRTGEQPLDDGAALVRTVVGKKIPDVGNRRDAAGQIQIHAAEEFGVIRQRGRGDVLGVPFGGDQTVDFGGEIGDVVLGPHRPLQGTRPTGQQGQKQGQTHGFELPHRDTPTAAGPGNRGKLRRNPAVRWINLIIPGEWAGRLPRCAILCSSSPQSFVHSGRLLGMNRE